MVALREEAAFLPEPAKRARYNFTREERKLQNLIATAWLRNATVDTISTVPGSYGVHALSYEMHQAWKAKEKKALELEEACLGGPLRKTQVSQVRKIAQEHQAARRKLARLEQAYASARVRPTLSRTFRVEILEERGEGVSALVTRYFDVEIGDTAKDDILELMRWKNMIRGGKQGRPTVHVEQPVWLERDSGSLELRSYIAEEYPRLPVILNDLVYSLRDEPDPDGAAAERDELLGVNQEVLYIGA
jgi:hypothetical protein